MDMLERAALLYPETAEEAKTRDWFYGPSDYSPMIDAFGAVGLRIDDSDYQGDTRVLYLEPDGRVGVLIFGWGSCSGCDALQACSSMADLADLITSTENSVQWFANRADALKWFEERDWPGEYSWHEEGTKEFVEKAKLLLAA